MPIESPPFPALGPTPVFTPPVGLQGYLGTKAVGQNPDRLSQTVYSFVDADPFYEIGLNLRRQSASFTPTVSGEVGFGALVVPPGKLWMILNHSTRTSGGAGDAADVVPCIIHQAAPTTPLYGPPSVANQGVTGASSRQQLNSWYHSRRRWFPHQYCFGYFVAFLTLATAVTTVVSIEYVEIDV